VTTSALLVVALLVPQSAPEPPKEAEYATARADVEAMNRRFDAAIRLYREALALSPDYPPARKGLGRVFDLQGRHAEAQAEYESGLRRATEWERSALLDQLAISLAFQRRYDEARSALQQWLDMALARTGGLLPLGYLRFHELAAARGDFDEAERVLEAFHAAQRKALPPGAGEPERMLSDIEWSRYQAVRAAMAARRGHADRARTLLRDAEGELGRALKRLGAPIGTADEVTFPAGEVAFWLGDLPRAIAAMAPMSVKLPRHHLMLGQAYEKQGDLNAARESYRRIVESPLLSLDLAWARPIAAARLEALGP
jgi:tetratricopeptide (TPR) repeat protein